MPPGRRRIPLSAPPMPTLGFLKKKRTKDSNGSKDLDSPTSPIKDTATPITPTTSRKSGSFHLHKTKTNESLTNNNTATTTTTAPAASAAQHKPVDSMNPAYAQQQQQQQPQQQQHGASPQSSHNTPSIQNLIHPNNASAPHREEDTNMPLLHTLLKLGRGKSWSFVPVEKSATTHHLPFYLDLSP
ncbi:cAMP-dependent kinase type 2 [Pyrenophora seminiperda CCB06]|uniref:cAMP-dependent kinase type 2 n=1 Tax=Pyrenophora seminiperda CCB06 TaxID=1302712 RepID=A0A3M7M0H1_9PLEO|nr:cAMP-dependent kinase type 2 [Pyrenophora seminiperda CCB06]